MQVLRLQNVVIFLSLTDLERERERKKIWAWTSPSLHAVSFAKTMMQDKENFMPKVINLCYFWQYTWAFNLRLHQSIDKQQPLSPLIGFCLHFLIHKKKEKNT